MEKKGESDVPLRCRICGYPANGPYCHSCSWVAEFDEPKVKKQIPKRTGRRKLTS